MTKEPLAVTLTTGELRALIREELVDAMKKTGAPREAPDILNAEQVAELLGVHRETVPRYAREKGLPVFGRVGSHLRFSRADVLAWIASHKV